MRKKSLKVKIKNNALWKKLTSDTAFRLLVVVSFSMGWNFLYSLFQVVLAFLYQSPWHVTLFVYYMILAFMRFCVIYLKKRNLLKYNGIAMIFLAVTMSGIVCLSISESRTAVYHMIIVITIVTYTFYQTTLSIINIIKAQKIKNNNLIILRNISVASSVGSMFSLECFMLRTFGDIRINFARNIEIISGAFAVGIILFLGFSMIKYGKNAEKCKKDGETVE